MMPARSSCAHLSMIKHLRSQTKILNYNSSFFPNTIVHWNALPLAVIETPTTMYLHLLMKDYTLKVITTSRVSSLVG